MNLAHDAKHIYIAYPVDNVRGPVRRYSQELPIKEKKAPSDLGFRTLTKEIPQNATET